MTDLMIGYWAPPRLDFPRGQVARFDNQSSFVGLLFARVAPLRCRWPLTRRYSRRRRCRIPLSAACSFTPGLFLDHISNFFLFCSDAVCEIIVVTEGAGPEGRGVV